VHYKFSPIIHFSYAKLWTFINSYGTNILSYRTVALSVSQANTSVSAWFGQYYLCSSCSVYLFLQEFFLTVYHTMPTCSCSIDVFLPPIWPWMSPVLP
jgi:hypothetical protein